MALTAGKILTETYFIYLQAFITLRKHGGLILSLFSMMISTGLPELSSEKDLNYLRETLVSSIDSQYQRDICFMARILIGSRLIRGGGS